MITFKQVICCGVFTLLGALTTPAVADTNYQENVRWMPPQIEWTEVPKQAPVTEGYVDINGVKLWYWDTGGSGKPVILMHPLTGSAAVWGYQQPVLVEAGYRVIAYSRRAHHKSDVGPRSNPGSAVGDLNAVADYLGLEKFHLVGSAGGGFIVPDYAVSHPERLLSITIAMSSSAVQDDALNHQNRMLLPKELTSRSTWFKELSPSYREANPSGVAQWQALEEIATPKGRLRQAKINTMTMDNFAKITTPTLLMTGDVDIYQPLPRMLTLAKNMTNTKPEIVVLTESGHSGYWEQPKAFNKVLIEFLNKH